MNNAENAEAEPPIDRRPAPSAGARVLLAPEARQAGAELIGGKAAGLAQLQGAGADVPPWFCVTTAVFHDLLAGAGAEASRLPSLLAERDRARLRRGAEELRAALIRGGLPDGDGARALGAFDQLFAPGDRVAVRSSVVGEDSSTDSFAGQMDSFLFVSRAALLDQVVACFASAFSDRALLYRQVRAQRAAAIRAAVVVQKMVPSTRAGVLFTVNPTGDPGQALIAAALGQGEGVVQGSVETDVWTLDRDDGQVRRAEIRRKASRLVFDGGAGRGTRAEATPEAHAAAPALSAPEVGRLYREGMRLERLFGRPLDIEWAFDDRGRLFLLQARPITTLRRETALNNANIVESYPGVCSPLTFSLARASYEEVFRESARAQGMPERFIREDMAMHANLLAYVDGRIYYNLTNWYKRFERIPGAVARIEAMERALGLPASGRVRVKRGAAARMAALPRDLRTLLRRARALLTLDNKVAAFLALLDGERAAFARRDLTALDAHGLLDLADALLSRLLAPYLISIANDGFAQLFYQRLVRLAARWCGDANGALANELLCGEQGMQSVDPVRSLVAVAERVAGHPELAALFAPGRDDQDAWRAIQQDARYADVKDALGAHLSSYGDRILHELKIESPSLEDDPAFVVSMLRNYLRAERNVRDMEASENAKRRQAEARAAAALRGHPIRRALFRFVLGQTRRTLKHRENLRLARTRGMGMLRRLYRRLGACFQADGLIDDQRDIALLTREEIAAAVRGSSATEDLRALIALRRGEQRTFAARRPPPGHIVAHGVVSAFVHGRRLTGQPDDAPGERRQARATLQGIACTPGSARARAKVVVEPSDDLAVSGEILVAPMTDPGWVFLMVAASGLVVEKGSVLSHTAIIGRELGIPTVVNVADAVRCIRSGDWVEIDGGTGRVTIEANEGGEPHAA